MLRVPVVIVAYNRPNALKRILSSISGADYPMNIDIELIISIDYSGSNACKKIAEDFIWEYGSKRVINHDNNLGLKKHILRCGDISEDNDGVIILEEDCFVSKDFYKFVLKAYEFYKDEYRVCGVSLYAYSVNEFVSMPFNPVKGHGDVYFMQVPCSWGQFWSKRVWSEFKKYLENNKTKELLHASKMPDKVSKWSDNSWKKYFYDFMIDNDYYFVYPYVSKSTNFCDEGVHMKQNHSHYQVPISVSSSEFKFENFNSDSIKYDSFYELKPECLKVPGFEAEKELCIDTYLLKNNSCIDKEWVVTSMKSDHAVQSFSDTLQPLINNVIYLLEGEGISILKRDDYIRHLSDRTPNRELLKKHMVLGYKKGFRDGKHHVFATKTYKLGEVISKIINLKRLF